MQDLTYKSNLSVYNELWFSYRIFWRTRRIFYMPNTATNHLICAKKIIIHIFFTLFKHISKFQGIQKKSIFFSNLKNRQNAHISSSTWASLTQTPFRLYEKIKSPLEKSAGELLELNSYQLRFNNQYSSSPHRFSGKWLFWSRSNFQ